MVSFNYDSELPWFVLHTKPKQEHIAAAYLRTFHHVPVFAPRIQFRRIQRNGTLWVTEALFPSYIFAQFDPVQDLLRVRSSNGVTNVVGFGGKPSTLSPYEIEQLRESLGPDEVKVINPELRVGDEVAISYGPMSNLRAVVTALLPARDRVKVLFDFLGRETELEVAPEKLIPRQMHPLAEPPAVKQAE
ncbi:MAG: transcription termination/antitermination NusG family protein [Verrucomicrobiae bacterium]|nr:transcription termination/antitermination NusG family protein [Verrucomicrobiae bacterium]